MTKERAKLAFDAPEEIPPPAVDKAAIKAAAQTLGLRETPREPATAPPTLSAEPLLRRARRKTGRVHQFATRLREDTLRQIIAYADRYELTMAEVIERAIDALAKQESRS
jgi:hypothetical protein